MKKINLYLLAGAACLLSACSVEDPFNGGTDEENMGQVDTRAMTLTVENHEIEVTRAVDVTAFEVNFVGVDGSIAKSYKYQEMPEIVTLPAGDYTVKVNSGNNEPAAWENRYYEGSQEFTVEARKITEVAPVVCKFSNVRVTIIFDADLKAVMSADTKVTVKVGNTSALDFTRDETRSGYFAYTEGNNTLVAAFTGFVDNNEEENYRPMTDVQPGHHYRITYKYHNAADPDLYGCIEIADGIYVNAEVEVEDLTVNADDGDDPLITPSDRPTEDPLDPEDPDEPVDPVDPGVNDVVIDIPAGMSQTEQKIVDGMTAVVHVTCPSGIKEFTVQIISNTLTADVLEGVGLSDNLDLVNPGEYTSGLQVLFFPDDPDWTGVGGETEVDFDITQFLPLIPVLGSDGHHKFVINVTGNNGNKQTGAMLLYND